MRTDNVSGTGHERGDVWAQDGARPVFVLRLCVLAVVFLFILPTPDAESSGRLSPLGAWIRPRALASSALVHEAQAPPAAGAGIAYIEYA